jgi:hypothetical protein
MVVEGRAAMGYQESFRPIKHLAEAAGIKRAIEEYDGHPELPEYCTFFCASRSKRTDELFACIGGQRCRVHIVAGIDLDDCVPYGEDYSDYFEDYDEERVEEAARERPDLAEKGYRDLVAAYEAELERNRERKRKIHESAEELKPSVEAFLKSYGPATRQELYAAIHIKGVIEGEALDELLEQGYLMPAGKKKEMRLWFADETIAGSLEDALERSPSTHTDRVMQVLKGFGPAALRRLSYYIGVSEYHIKKALQPLLEEGRVSVDKSHRPYVYSLAAGV